MKLQSESLNKYQEKLIEDFLKNNDIDTFTKEDIGLKRSLCGKTIEDCKWCKTYLELIDLWDAIRNIDAHLGTALFFREQTNPERYLNVKKLIVLVARLKNDQIKYTVWKVKCAKT